MFSPHMFSANLGRRDLGNFSSEQSLSEMQLIAKFYKKYPEIKYMPLLGPLHMKHGGAMTLTHPASVFVRKQ